MTNLLLDHPDLAPIVHMEERSELINRVFHNHNQDPRDTEADKVRAEVAKAIAKARQQAGTDHPTIYQ
jgi:hypothetical protein